MSPLPTATISRLAGLDRLKVGQYADALQLAPTIPGKARAFTLGEAALLVLIRHLTRRLGFIEAAAVGIASTIRAADLERAIARDPEPTFLLLTTDDRPGEPPWSTTVMSATELEAWRREEACTLIPGIPIALNTILRAVLEAAGATDRGNKPIMSQTDPGTVERLPSTLPNGLHIRADGTIEIVADGTAARARLSPERLRELAAQLLDLAQRNGARADG